MTARWRALERELMEPRFREAMRLPYGPLDLEAQLELELHLCNYLEFMRRTIYGDMLGRFAPVLMKVLRDEVNDMRPLLQIPFQLAHAPRGVLKIGDVESSGDRPADETKS